MSLEIPAIDGGGTDGGLLVSEVVFGQAFNEPLVHQFVTAYLAGARSGTRAQKSRSDVRGGGRKPWRQKGTGRARAGTSTSPLWRKGGVTFAARNQNHRQKLNKKMYRAALRSIFSELLRQNRLAVADNLAPETPKTRALVERLKACDVREVLIITEREEKNLVLAARNLSGVDVCTVHNLKPVALVSLDKVIATREAIRNLEERLG